jgi:hypothetical protein
VGNLNATENSEDFSVDGVILKRISDIGRKGVEFIYVA